LLTGEGGGGGRGAEQYDLKKAWSSINHSILSAVHNRKRQKPTEKREQVVKFISSKIGKLTTN
jgi:hypothetical protein